MPERRPRPIYAQRHYEYDEPPASEDPPWSTRRRMFGERRRYQRTQYESDQASAAIHDYLNRPQSRDPVTSAHPRRRQRSASPEDDAPPDGTYPNYRSRGYDDLRQRMTKRRRIDPDVLPITCPPIKYGHFGQVEPGRLKMFLVSCDGGQHTDYKNPAIDLGPHNVLRTDKSVYCSARERASIVLRHADDTPFSLTQLSIVAPEHGFTAPVSEGVAFVGMTMDALAKYTEKADESSPADAEPPPYEEPERSHSNFDIDNYLSESAFMSTPDSHEHGELDDDEDNGEGNNSAQARTTLADDIDLGPEDDTSPAVLDYRLQRMRQLQRRQEGMRWRDRRLNRSIPLTDDFSAFVTSTGIPDGDTEPESRPQYRRYRPDMLAHLFPSADEPEPEESSRTKQQRERLLEAGRLPKQDPEVTFVWFKVSEKTHKVTINFSTPVSGRFVLLKLAAAWKTDNVDVQSIMAVGYAGPRFFPALHPR